MRTYDSSEVRRRLFYRGQRVSERTAFILRVIDAVVVRRWEACRQNERGRTAVNIEISCGFSVFSFGLHQKCNVTGRTVFLFTD